MNKISLFFFLLANTCFAQDVTVLTYEQAAEAVISTNFGVQVVKNDAAIAANNNTAGNAGMLPDVSFNASGSYANNATNQEYSNGLSVNRSGVVSNGMNSGILLSWTVFDGMRMFAAKDRLEETQAMSDLRLKQQIENTLLQVAQVYYELVRQKQQISAIKENIKVYEERLTIAQTRLDIGKAPKTDLLLAKVDLNEQKVMLIEAENNFRTAQVQLNQLMSKPAEGEFDVSDEITITYSPGYDELKTSFAKKNNTVLLAERNVNLSTYLKREIEAMRYPRLTLNTSYNFTRTANQAGLVLLNQNLGLNAGFVLNWTLFSGFRTRTQVKNAEITIMSAQLNLQDSKLKAETALLQAWRKLESVKKILALEEDNYSLAKENMDISLERFKLGNMTTVEFKQTQMSLQEVQLRLINARYDAKQAETDLMRLNGDLVK
jgi:outer membrane protein